MPIDRSDQPCPECGTHLQVIYVGELKQVISGWACPACGFFDSEKGGQDSGTLSRDEPAEYVLLVQQSLTKDDVRSSLSDVETEFRARARESMSDDEVWFLIDPDTDTVIDVVGDQDHAGKQS